MDITKMAEHLASTQTRESHGRLKETGDRMQKLSPEDSQNIHAELVQANNIAEHLMKVIIEEYQMEPFDAKVLCMALYTMMYGTLASCQGVAEVATMSKMLEQGHDLSQKFMVRAALGMLFKGR